MRYIRKEFAPEFFLIFKQFDLFLFIDRPFLNLFLYICQGVNSPLLGESRLQVVPKLKMMDQFINYFDLAIEIALHQVIEHCKSNKQAYYKSKECVEVIFLEVVINKGQSQCYQRGI